MNNDLFLSRIEIKNQIPSESYLSNVPAVTNLARLGKLEFSSPVTFFVGENGVGKSTLIEAIAVSMGFNPEGGSINFKFSTNDSHSELYKYLSVVKTLRRRRDGYFLRAESFYNAISYIDELDKIPAFSPRIVESYGGRSLHNRSHGESFLSLVENRFGGNGIYILDEPEAALSPRKIMRLMVLIKNLVDKGAQFIISTHSPILITFPQAQIYQFTDDSIESLTYNETEHFNITKQFVSNPERMINALFE